MVYMLLMVYFDNTQNNKTQKIYKKVCYIGIYILYLN